MSIEEQGQQEQTEQTAKQPDPAVSAFQSRLDQLTTSFQNLQAQNAELMARNSELVAQIALKQQAAPVQPELPPVPEGVDPSLPKFLEEVVSRATAPLKAELSALRKETGGARQQSADAVAWGEVNTQLAKLNDPAITNRVQSLVAAWRNDAEQKFAHATPRDALKIAIGEKALGTLVDSGTQPRDERGRFNTNAAPIPGGGGRSTQVTRTQPVSVEQRLAEADLNNMSLKELAALNKDLDAKYPDGFLLKKD